VDEVAFIHGVKKEVFKWVRTGLGARMKKKDGSQCHNVTLR